MFHTLGDGVNMYYEVHGNSSSKNSIVFLNGLSQSTIAWTAVIPSLLAKNRIVLLDLVFQGQSGASSEYRSFDQHANDVTSLLTFLKIEKAIICGISYGGAVAQHLAVNHDSICSGLILVSTFAHKTAHFNAIGSSWITALNAGGYPLMLEIMLPVVLGEDYFESPIIPIETLKQMRIGAQPQPANLLQLMMATEHREDYRATLKKISIPTLIIHGEKDLLIPVHMANEIHTAIKGSRIEVLVKAGHTLNLEAIKELSTLIREFSELV